MTTINDYCIYNTWTCQCFLAQHVMRQLVGHIRLQTCLVIATWFAAKSQGLSLPLKAILSKVSNYLICSSDQHLKTLKNTLLTILVAEIASTACFMWLGALLNKKRPRARPFALLSKMSIAQLTCVMSSLASKYPLQFFPGLNIMRACRVIIESAIKL